MEKLFLAAAMLAAACSGSTTPPAERPVATETASGEGDAVAPDDAATPLDDAECRAIIDHYIDVFMSEKRATEPPEHLPTDAQIADIRDALYAEAATGCVGSPRTGYDCAMNADSSTAIGACLPKEKEAAP